MKKAIVQRIFFTIGFSFIAIMTYQNLTHQYQTIQSDSYIETVCEIQQNEFLMSGESQKLLLRYTYQVDDKIYEGKTYLFGLHKFENQMRAGAKSFVKNFPPGSKRECFYDSKNLEHSTLRRANAHLWYENIALYIFFLAFGFGFYLSWFFPALAEKTFIPSDPS